MMQLNEQFPEQQILHSLCAKLSWSHFRQLISLKDPLAREFYTHDQYLEYIGVKAKDGQSSIVVYSRVSSVAQKPDLANQIKALESFCAANGYAVTEWLSETGSGLNYKRQKFNKIFLDIEMGKVAVLIIAHQDRLVRFGFDWFQTFAERHGCKIVIMNQESLSPTEEVTQDLLAIIHCFSSRLYGLRKYKDKVKKLVQTKEV